MSNNIQSLNKNRSLIVDNNILIATKNDKECKLNLLEIPYLFAGGILNDVFCSTSIFTYDDKISKKIVNIPNCILCDCDIIENDDILFSECCGNFNHIDCQLKLGYSEDTCVHCLKTFEFIPVNEFDSNEECYICYMNKDDTDDDFIVNNSCCNKFAHYSCFKHVKKPNVCCCCKTTIEIINRPKKLRIKDMMFSFLEENTKRNTIIYNALMKEPIQVLEDDDYFEETDDETESEEEEEEEEYSFEMDEDHEYSEEELDAEFLRYLLMTDDHKIEHEFCEQILNFERYERFSYQEDITSLQYNNLIDLVIAYNLYLKNIGDINYKNVYTIKLDIFKNTYKCNISLGLKDPSLEFKLYSSDDEIMKHIIKYSTMNEEETISYNNSIEHVGFDYFNINFYSEKLYSLKSSKLLVMLFIAHSKNNVEDIETITNNLKNDYNHIVTLKFE